MSSVQYNQVAYGLSQALIGLFPAPIVSNSQSPTSSNLAQIGTIWINKSANAAFILTSIVSNAATWTDLSGAAGVFTSLTVNPGPTALSTVGNGAVSIGNSSNTGAITITAGTGNFSLVGAGHTVGIANDAAANLVTVGSTTGAASLTLQAGTGNMALTTSATGTITVGAATMTGTITIGSSTAGQAINIGTAAGADVITIGNVTALTSLTLNAGTGNMLLATSATGTITVGSAAMTGALTLGLSTAGQIINIGNGVNVGAQTINIASGNSGANSAVNILNGAATAGAQTFNLMASGGQAGFVNIANGAAANTVVLGSTTGAALTTIQGGTGGVNVSAPFLALPGPVYFYTGAGAPGNPLALHVGDTYWRTDAGGATERIYVATGVGAWTNVTCAG